MERELLEQMVVEACARGDAHATRAVEAEPHAERGLRSRTNMPCASSLRRARALERGEQQIVVLGVAHRDANAAAGDAHDAAAGEQLSAIASGSGTGDEDEVRVRLERRVAERAEPLGEPLALFEHGRDVGRCAKRREGECDGQASRRERAPGAHAARRRCRAHASR